MNIIIIRYSMAKDNLKLEELRAIFNRENYRKDSLQSKASYFLGVISIVVTIICTNFNLFNPIDKYFSYVGGFILSGLILSFLLSLGFCAYIFLPKNYTHPFDFDNFDESVENLDSKNDELEESLEDQYITSIKTNHDLNNQLVVNLKISVISFLIFLIFYFLMVCLL